MLSAHARITEIQESLACQCSKGLSYVQYIARVITLRVLIKRPRCAGLPCIVTPTGQHDALLQAFYRVPYPYAQHQTSTNSDQPLTRALTLILSPPVSPPV
jgi:hypothetical protein